MPPRNVCWLISALVITACGPDEREESPTPEDESLTSQGVSPTPTPTPAPALDTWQKMTRLELMDEPQTCLDLDGDGSSDNGLPIALAELAASVLEAVNAEINAMAESGEINDQQALALQNLADEVIHATISVESINTSLANDIEQGDGFVAYELWARSPYSNLLFWEVYEQGGGVIVPRGQVGEANTSEDPLGGEVYFGPGYFTLGTVVVVPETPENPEQAFDLTFYVADVGVLMDYDPTFTRDAVMGGGIEIIALTALLEQLLTTIETLVPIDLSGLIDPIYEQLLRLSDIDCANGDPCMSTCLSFDAITTVVATP